MTASGVGRAPGTCGELVQGALPDGTCFQVTLPVDVWAEVGVRLVPAAGTAVVGIGDGLWKLRRAVALALDRFGMGPARAEVVRVNPLAVGQGFGSSTADVVAGLRAVAAAAGYRPSPEELTELAATVDPADGVAFERIVAVSRRGRLLRDWTWQPRFHVVAVSTGTVVDTVAADVARYLRCAGEYEALLSELDGAAARRDERRFARVATASAHLHSAMVGTPLLGLLSGVYAESGALGIAVAHTGSCAGLLLPAGATRGAVLGAARAVGAATGLRPMLFTSLRS